MSEGKFRAATRQDGKTHCNQVERGNKMARLRVANFSVKSKEESTAVAKVPEAENLGSVSIYATVTLLLS